MTIKGERLFAYICLLIGISGVLFEIWHLMIDFEFISLILDFAMISIYAIVGLSGYAYLYSRKEFETTVKAQVTLLSGEKAFFIIRNKKTTYYRFTDNIIELLHSKGYKNVIVLDNELLPGQRHLLYELDCYQGHIDIRGAAIEEVI